jgi:hypothetical protein
LPDQPAIDVHVLQEALNQAIHRHGVSVSLLYIHSRELVDLLVPPNGDSGTKSIQLRAIKAEALIYQAIDAIREYDGPSAEAIRIIIGLRHDSKNRPTLHNRRIDAADMLGIGPDHFRKAYEQDLLLMLAFEILKIRG